MIHISPSISLPHDPSPLIRRTTILVLLQNKNYPPLLVGCSTNFHLLYSCSDDVLMNPWQILVGQPTPCCIYFFTNRENTPARWAFISYHLFTMSNTKTFLLCGSLPGFGSQSSGLPLQCKAALGLARHVAPWMWSLLHSHICSLIIRIFCFGDCLANNPLKKVFPSSLTVKYSLFYIIELNILIQWPISTGSYWNTPEGHGSPAVIWIWPGAFDAWPSLPSLRVSCHSQLSNCLIKAKYPKHFYTYFATGVTLKGLNI